MANFEVKNKMVYVPHFRAVGIAKETDKSGNITKVEIDGSLHDTTFLIVELWELISAIRKLIILIFKK